MVIHIDKTRISTLEFLHRGRRRLSCKKINMTRSYINRSNVHLRIGRRRIYGVAFCGGIDSAKGCKGGKCCCDEKTIIHKSAGGNIIKHKGVGDGKSRTKGDGDGKT
jgi:hypothetical protein